MDCRVRAHGAFSSRSFKWNVESAVRASDINASHVHKVEEPVEEAATSDQNDQADLSTY